MSVTCRECGVVLKADWALNAHTGSLPCQLAKTFREMEQRGWEACDVFDARDVLDAAGVDYEWAPAEYNAGGMRHPTQGVPGKRARFIRPDLRDATWCPAWARPVVNAALPREIRIRILKWALKDMVPHVNALKSAIALGGIEALAVLGE